MAYVPVPKDLTKVKTKVFFGLTKRQLICFGAGALLGVPMFFLLKGSGTSVTAFVMVLIMLPAFLLAMYEKNGQTLEVIVRNMLAVFFFRQKQRRYATRNFYVLLEQQHQLDKEVARIVAQGKTKGKKT